jgi:Domain of unknown function (DUF4340)
MKLRALIVVIVVLAGLEVWAWRHDVSRRDQAGGSDLVDSPLVEAEQINRAHRIVVREKPQSKLINTGVEGFEIRRIVDKNAPIRETDLELRDNGQWVVANYFNLDVDPVWLGQTIRDLSEGRLTRYVTSDPKLMNDLEFELGQIRLEDEKGNIIRQIDFGRKDGGDAYQFVRIDGKQAFVAKHQTELVGDPLAWIVTRVLRFDPADIRELEFPVQKSDEAPVVLSRAAHGAPLMPTDTTIASREQIAENVDRILPKILNEQVMLAIDLKSPVVAVARHHIAAQLRVVLFDGKQYKIAYGVVPKNDPSLKSLADDGSDLAIAFYECSDPKDITQTYGAKVALGYSQLATVGRLPKDRTALAAAPKPPVPDDAEPKAPGP